MAGFLVGIGKAGEVAERSPAVISANLKEDMLLYKKRVVLDRSARNLVHQIKVDQKVVYKNFQSRLVRSKLAFARLMGQKDIEKDLRAKNLGGLNTDIVGAADEEYTFLDKLQQRPCTASSFSPRVAVPRRNTPKPDDNGKRKSHMLKGLGVQQEAQREIINKTDARPSSTKGRVENKTQDVTPVSSNRDKTVRPATTIGTRVTEDFIRHQVNKAKDKTDVDRSEVKDADCSDNQSDKTDRDKLKPIETDEDNDIDNGKNQHIESEVSSESEKGNIDKIHTAAKDEEPKQGVEGEEDNQTLNDTKTTVAFADELGLDLDKLRRPRTVATTGHASSMSESPPISPKQFSRRASRASDFFQEEKKIDLVQLRLNAARAVNFTDQVKKFCETIESTIDPSNKPTTDYYTIRLETSMKERLMSDIVNVPGTPDDENKRAVGNIHIRSLTVPEINWNFN